MRFYELKEKDVVELKSAQLLGEVYDIGFDPSTHKVTCIYVRKKQSGVRKWFAWLFEEKEHVILIEDIKHLQGDVILVVQEKM